MKFAAFLGGIAALGALISAFMLGWSIGHRRGYTRMLQGLGLNRRSADLYLRAVKIIKRLHGQTDIERIAAGDDLCPETKQLVTEWMADYRNEVQRS